MRLEIEQGMPEYMRDFLCNALELAAVDCYEIEGLMAINDLWQIVNLPGYENLRDKPFMGDFMAYEIVSDLQYTALLDQAPDIMTWANAGPGARRGLNRVFGRDLRATTTKHQQCREMQELLAMSQSGEYWPQVHYGSEDNPSWDMRTVEHTLCEFDKYERVRLGEGAPRQRFRP